MPRPRFHKLPPQTKEKILDAAQEEFAQLGFDGASYNRIIERAGLSKGAMYYYFDDKVDLYCTVLERVIEHILEQMGGLSRGEPLEGDFWEAIEEEVRRASTFALEEPEIMAVAKGMLSLPGKLRREGPLGELYGRAQAFTQKILELGQELGEVRTDVPKDLLVHMVFAMDEAIDIWLLEALTEGDTPNPEVIESALAVWLDMIQRVVEPRTDDEEE